MEELRGGAIVTSADLGRLLTLQEIQLLQRALGEKLEEELGSLSEEDIPYNGILSDDEMKKEMLNELLLKYKSPF